MRSGLWTCPALDSTAFTYSVLPTFDRDTQGFDRLEIFTLTRADTVRSVRVDGVEVSDQFPPEIQADRILVALPRLQGGDDTFKLVEVEFDARVVRYGTEFQGWIFDSQGTGVKQLIEPGDATVDFPGNALGVRPAGLGDALLTQVSVFPQSVHAQRRWSQRCGSLSVSTPRGIRPARFAAAGV